jgi:hypothetical protein
MLYRPLARSPQLENAGVWTAPPILISGASAYRRGEFLYQDFIYDDTGNTYPSEPRNGSNAADFVEIRMKPLADSLAIRITYNTMLDPELDAATIALGGSPAAQAMPHNAGASMPANVFVTVHGCTGDIVSAATGSALPIKPTVATDLERRQVDVRVPYSAFDPRGQKAVRVGAAAGLWDAAKSQYWRPPADATGHQAPAFFNVAFRYGEPLVGFDDTQQDAALQTGDLSQFYASVDFTKLAAGTNDDMPGKWGGVPQTGYMNRIAVSHYEYAQGRGTDSSALSPGGRKCDPPACLDQYSGRLQPYAVYIPQTPAPPNGYGLAVALHAADQSYNPDSSPGGTLGNPSPIYPMLAGLNGGMITVAPLGRGPSYWYYGLAADSVFEAWADIAARYPLDATKTVLTGMSMGGYGTFKLATQWPDLFAAAVADVPCMAMQVGWPGPPTPPSLAPAESSVFGQLGSMRYVPLLGFYGQQDPVCPSNTNVQVSQMFDSAGYRYDLVYASGSHEEFRMTTPVGDSEPIMARFLQGRRVVSDPSHITYTVNAFQNEPQYGLNSDHAYWVSGLRLRQGAPDGTIDVRSDGFGSGDPSLNPTQNMAGVGTQPAPPYGFEYAERSRTWGDAPTEAARNQLDIEATNISAVTINPARARVSCNAVLNIKSNGPIKVTLSGCRPGAPSGKHRLRCARPSGRLAGGRLGPIALGMIRARARHAFLRFSTRHRGDMDFFCLTPGGIRVGYPSPRVLAWLSSRERRKVSGRAVLLLTSSRYYDLRGVRPGARLVNAARVLRIGRPFHIGLNYWYLAPNDASRGVLKVRNGVVEEIGIADDTLTANRRGAWRFLSSFS